MRREPKIILFDLETLPNMAQVMKVYPRLSDYPGLTLKAQITSVICFGFKEFGTKDKPTCVSAWDFPSWKKNVNDDKDLVARARETIADADAVVTHNGRRFDWKFLQTRLMIHGLDPLPKIPHIDTCAEAKRNIFLLNNKLDTLGEHLVGDRKIDNGGWDLWVRVMAREKKALKEMAEYCTQDVALLEKIFKKMRPFMTNIPNYNLFSIGEQHRCPNCGSTRLRRNGWRTNKTRRYQRLVCLDCATSSRTDSEGRLPRT